MKPKPLSIQHRFILLQASAFALAIWLLAWTLYVDLRIHHEITGALGELQEALTLNAAIESTLAELRGIARQAAQDPPSAPTSEFERAARQLTTLTHNYAATQRTRPHRQWLAAVQQMEARLIERIQGIFVRERGTNAPETRLQTQEVYRLTVQIELLLRNRANEQLEQLAISRNRLEGYTRTLCLLFTAFGLFAIVALLQFRRAHRREIWDPLEDLRRMVMEVRRGNLNLTGKVPSSIEFGTLVRGFLEMAGELREMRDSLEQKVRERTAKLEATQSELVQAAKLSALGQLVSGVAHEINNPLTSILGYSELVLRRPELDARLRVHLQTIRDEAVRLKNLVANLSSFARRQPQRTERVDLRQVLGRLVELRQYQLNASNIELHYEPPADPVWVEGDRDQLLQVFFDLVLNSEQAIGSYRTQGDIRLACGVEAGRAWATVRDNGTGMPPAVRERIFDPFFTTKPVGQGAGLGLSISHGIIQQHRGTIAAESAEGQGTAMRISLPAAVTASEVPSAPVEIVVENNAAAGAGLRALIIDDEPTIAQMIQQFLESQGWTPAVLNDSTAVDSNLEGQHFDLVICDLKMPGRNGLEILRLLRQKHPELARRFLLMTGHLADAQEKEILELPGVPVLRKPFTLAQLADALRVLVPNRGEPYKD